MGDVELSPWTRTATTDSELESKRLSANGSAIAGNWLHDEFRAADVGSATTAGTGGALAKAESHHEHITGLKLFACLASVTLAAFLMLLDGSIIGVVSVDFVASVCFLN
jgi:hypothetical protein